MEMISLLEAAALVATDSGGLQKEAFFFQTPCVTLRDETEWVELVDAGYNQLAGAESARILQAIEEMRAKDLDFNNPLYGKGDAAMEILKALLAK